MKLAAIAILTSNYGPEEFAADLKALVLIGIVVMLFIAALAPVLGE